MSTSTPSVFVPSHACLTLLRSTLPVLRTRRPRASSLHRYPARPVVATLTPWPAMVGEAPPATDLESAQHSSAEENNQPKATPIDESLALLEWPAITARVLRHASTELGERNLVDSSNERHLHIPDTRTGSEHLLQQTREMRRLETSLTTPLDFTHARDVGPLARYSVKGRVLTGGELLSIAQTLAVARIIRRTIVDAGEDTVPHLHSLVASLKTATAAERELFHCVDEYGDLAESAHPKLRGVRDEIRNATENARSTLISLMSRHSDAVQDRLIMSRYDRFVIPVKTSHKSTFRSGIVHDASASGGTAFLEPAEVRPINDRLRALAAKERSIVLEALRRLSTEVVAVVADDIALVCDVLAILDAAAARARVSESLSAVDVTFDDDSPLYLPAVRHPMLMWAAIDTASFTDHDSKDDVQSNDSPWVDAVIPSTYTLSPTVRCVCVTGPNTGGKTLTLKTLGVAALMAKAGLFIPATPPPSLDLDTQIRRDDTEPDDTRVSIPFFDKVLADIGDDQSLVQSLSTFSGHVRRIKRILSASTPQSLVLLDEIGSGTDPAEGAALGMAVLRHLAVGARAKLTFATTHHGELKTLKYAADDSAPLFENASVEFDDVAMKPTYRLMWGIPGRSNALAIAKRLGLDNRVVSAAKELLTSGSMTEGESSHVDVEKMIRSLENDKRKAEEALVNAKRKLSEVDTMRDELVSRLETLRKRESQLRKEQRHKVEQEVALARKEIARVIKDMQQAGSAQAASRASDLLRGIEKRSVQLSGAGNGKERHRVVSPDEIEVGDRVVVHGLADGEVEVVEKVSGKEIMVAMGAMKVKTKISDVVGVRRVTTAPGPSAASVELLPVAKQEEPTDARADKLVMRTAANSIDVRGQRVDAAVAKIDAAIDKAMATGALWIIHGHGTGRLRNGVRRFLAEHSLVNRFDYAEQSEGGTGVTIAYF